MNKSSTTVAFGMRIKAGRTRLGLTVEEFAERLSVSKATQSNYEAGTTIPNLEYAEKCAELGVYISEKLVPSGKRQDSNKLNDDETSVQLIRIILNHWDPGFDKKRIPTLLGDLLDLYRARKR